MQLERQHVFVGPWREEALGCQVSRKGQKATFR
jgi:hypothetical protein